MGEQIVIGEDIVITVVDTRNDTVRLGITAPRSVRVDRAELLRAVAAANREAAGADDSAIEALRTLGMPASTGSARASLAGAGATPENAPQQPRPAVRAGRDDAAAQSDEAAR